MEVEWKAAKPLLRLATVTVVMAAWLAKLSKPTCHDSQAEHTYLWEQSKQLSVTFC